MDFVERIRFFWAKNRNAYMRLLIINVAFTISVWVTGLIIGHSNFVRVPESFNELVKIPYTLITYMFAHDGFMHLLGNMFLLYFVGSVFEDLLGTKKTIQAYLLSGLVGALAYVLLVNQESNLIGASGAIMGLLYGLTIIKPNYQFFLYGLIKLKLWWITVAVASYDLLMILASNAQAGGKVCHVAGGLTGVLLVAIWTDRIKWRLNSSNSRNEVIKPYKITVNRNPSRPTRASESSTNNNIPSQEDIDSILDKINESGYDSLTKKEKDMLFRAKDIEV
jgi:membrane associated rhomboid family serine protease